MEPAADAKMPVDGVGVRPAHADDVILEALRHVTELTPRERDVFQLLGLGLSNRSIARRLEVSEAESQGPC